MTPTIPSSIDDRLGPRFQIALWVLAATALGTLLLGLNQSIQAVVPLDWLGTEIWKQRFDTVQSIRAIIDPGLFLLTMVGCTILAFNHPTKRGRVLAWAAAALFSCRFLVSVSMGWIGLEVSSTLRVVLFSLPGAGGSILVLLSVLGALRVERARGLMALAWTALALYSVAVLLRLVYYVGRPADRSDWWTWGYVIGALATFTYLAVAMNVLTLLAYARWRQNRARDATDPIPDDLPDVRWSDAAAGLARFRWALLSNVILQVLLLIAVLFAHTLNSATGLLILVVISSVTGLTLSGLMAGGILRFGKHLPDTCPGAGLAVLSFIALGLSVLGQGYQLLLVVTTLGSKSFSALVRMQEHMQVLVLVLPALGMVAMLLLIGALASTARVTGGTWLSAHLRRLLSLGASVAVLVVVVALLAKVWLIDVPILVLLPLFAVGASLYLSVAFVVALGDVHNRVLSLDTHPRG